MKLKRQLYQAKKEMGLVGPAVETKTSDVVQNDVPEGKAPSEEDFDDDVENVTSKSSDEPSSLGMKGHARHAAKPSPFRLAEKEAQASIAAREARQAEYEVRQQERLKKLAKRERQSKLLRKTTKRGQPIMKHKIDYLLDKIIAKKL